jgi:hypothetical protein
LLSPSAAALSTEPRRSEPYFGGEFLREVPEVLGQAASRREWERDRAAWNLPRKPSDVGARPSR